MEKSVDEKSDSKFSFLFTKKFLIILLLGQFLSLCITATSVTTQELAIEGVNFPTTQSFLNYVVLNLIYTSITIWKMGFKGWLKMLKNRGWMYFILAFIDVEGNYFVVKAYQYTSLLSAMLLDNWSTLVCMILLISFFKVTYHWSQYLGALMCFAGIGVLLRGDVILGQTDEITASTNMLKGDLFLLLGSTLYGFSNVGEQYFVRQFPLYEVVGQMGFFGTIINGVQLAILERQELESTPWSGRIVGLLIAFNFAMFCLYTGAPQLFRISSATFFNLSLITSDFYGLIFALFLFGQKMHGLYPLAYIMSVVGLIVYHVYPETEPQIRRLADEEAPEPRSEQAPQIANDILAKD